MASKISAAVFLCAFLMTAVSFAAGDGEKWIASQPKLYTVKERARFNRFLGELHRRFPTLEGRMRALALARVGTPYSLGCLGEEKPPDQKPFFRVDVTDCTVFVLTTLAMAHGSTWDEARELMKKLNYHNPPMVGTKTVSYQNRQHFTYERLHSCPFFADITASLAAPSVCGKATVTLNRKSDGTKLLDIPWEKEVTALYIPAAQVDEKLVAKLPSAAGVAFVRKKNFSLGIVVSHEGLVIDRKWLFHANSISKKVEKRSFLDYLSENSDYFDGVIFSRFY
ncbi:MAG: DUF1460 domain-containing protein [Candidatus Eremiobacteraeota bacterium]|nr:DUF1460 domain-containing protein [Candidatus Eremiobacteraeota bacterium]